MQNYPTWSCLVALLLAIGIAYAQPSELSAQETSLATADDPPPVPPSGEPAGLLDLNLDQLSKQDVVVPALDTVVNSVTREVSTVGKSAAAVFVITPEMIRRSGATSIPELLRMAPGIEVAKIDANTWAISARGFNEQFSNKLLVMIDRRIVYNALYGGVYWDVQDVVLQDVERIEVIRGPGTVAWGSNAVNGVINIITKRPGDTQGALVSSAGGNQDLNNNTVRYGAHVGDWNWRAYGREFNRNSGFDPAGPTYDSWRQDRGGFRGEWAATKEDTFNCQGDCYNGYSGRDQVVALPTFPFVANDTDPSHVSGGNALLRWSHVLDEESDWQIQSFYDQAQRQDQTLSDDLTTYDIDFQHRFALTDRQQVIWGADYRHNSDVSSGSFAFELLPPTGMTQWASVFVDDKITLVDDRWYFSPGARLEYNTYGGLQAEPSGRLLFLPDERHSCWASISRAARNPTQVEATGMVTANLVPGTPTYYQVQGNPAIAAESVMAYEIGFRAQPTDRLSWDLAMYINDYHNVVGMTPLAPVVLPAGLFYPALFTNSLGGRTHGVELTGTWKMSDTWRLFGSYTFLDMMIHNSSGQLDLPTNGTSPRNQAYVRSSWDLTPKVDCDLIGRYVDNLPGIGVPSYFTMDMRLAWRVTQRTEAAVVGQNLLAPHHLEFVDNAAGLVSTQVPRSVYGSMTWKW
jgi:iron complex outermembrane recepter protein